MTLDRDDVEAIARRVIQLIGAEKTEDVFIDAQDAARRLGVRRAWVYAHARELGGVRLGDGARAPLRFDPSDLRARARQLQADAETNSAGKDQAAPAAPRASARTRTAIDVSLIKGRVSRRTGTA